MDLTLELICPAIRLSRAIISKNLRVAHIDADRTILAERFLEDTMTIFDRDNLGHRVELTHPAHLVRTITLGGSMKPYARSMGGEMWPHITPLLVKQGQRVELELVNRTMMARGNAGPTKRAGLTRYMVPPPRYPSAGDGSA
jgi:hypothetical protein